MKIKVGDLVTHIEDEWKPPMKVRKIITTDHGDCALFEGGGFWATDRLVKLPDVSGDKNAD